LGNKPSDAEKSDGTAKEDGTATNVREMLDYLEGQVMRGREMGVDFSEVESMITGARIIIESGEVSDAADIINECMQRASARYSEYESLVAGIRRAEMEIQKAHQSGQNVTEAGTKLRIARALMDKGDYRSAGETARQAVESLCGPKQQEVSWGSGLSDNETA